jgi:hypothetical protein
MRMHFWMVAMATVLGGAFLSGTVPQTDTPKALASRPTIAEDPPHPEATGWSCDGSGHRYDLRLHPNTLAIIAREPDDD